MAPVLLSRAEKSYLLAGLGAKPAQRHDGRALTDVRPIEVDSHMSEQADGCARVTPVSYTHLTLPTILLV